MKEGLCPDMPFMVNDWLSSSAVTVMSLAEQGAFLRLLCHAWNEPHCNVPDKPEHLAALSGLGPAWEQGSGATLMKCFVPDPERPGMLFNRTQRNTRQLQNKRREDAAEKCAKMRMGKAKRAQEGAAKSASKEASKDPPKALSGKDASKDPYKALSSPVSRLPSIKFSKENLPAVLAASPQFLEDWDLWVEFRSKEKRNPLKPSSTHSQLKDLAEMGVARAIASIRQSIKNGYTGLFEPRDMPAGVAPPKKDDGPWLPNPLDSL